MFWPHWIPYKTLILSGDVSEHEAMKA